MAGASFQRLQLWVTARQLHTPQQTLRIESSRDGKWALLAVSGPLNASTVKIFTAELDRILAGSDPPSGILVDIGDSTFSDSSGIRAALLTSQRVDGRFALVRMSEKLQRLLALKGLADVLHSYPDFETAKAALSGSR